VVGLDVQRQVLRRSGFPAKETVAANDTFGEMQGMMVELSGLMWWG